MSPKQPRDQLQACPGAAFQGCSGGQGPGHAPCLAPSQPRLGSAVISQAKSVGSRGQASACPGLRASTSSRGGAAQAHAPGPAGSTSLTPARLPLRIQMASHATPRFCVTLGPGAPAVCSRGSSGGLSLNFKPSRVAEPAPAPSAHISPAAQSPRGRSHLRRRVQECPLRRQLWPKLPLSPPLRRLLRAGEARAGRADCAEPSHLPPPGPRVPVVRLPCWRARRGNRCLCAVRRLAGTAAEPWARTTRLGSQNSGNCSSNPRTNHLFKPLDPGSCSLHPERLFHLVLRLYNTR